MKVRTSIFAALALIGYLVLGTVSYGQAVPVLGAAGNFGVLALGGSETVNNSNVKITGNEGAVYGAKISNQAPSSVTGNVYVNASSQYNGAGAVGGSVVADPTSMSTSGTVETAINNLITTLNNNAYPTIGPLYFGSGINSATTINATGSLTEVEINGNVSLNNANLTLNGAAGDTRPAGTRCTQTRRSDLSRDARTT